VHIPVLLTEVITSFEGLNNGVFVDATLGMGGHSREILEKIPNSSVIGIDLDSDAVLLAQQNLSSFGNRVNITQGNYVDMVQIVRNFNNCDVDGILLDLGLSSMQIDDTQRGFSFRFDSDLDMRFDKTKGMSASEVLNSFDESELADIFYKYGEERQSRIIAKSIVDSRPIKTTFDLTKIISNSKRQSKSKINPSTKVFQALRIYVNQELRNVEKGLEEALKLLKFGGNLSVISYHSLEDRIVKNFFKKNSLNCVCPVSVIECQCQHSALIKIINKKVIKPNEQEIASNPRSRSAKLRIVQRISLNVSM
tara:strand:+ start:3091 stop:4017 length:927 start_codon:yes stop_codon:yes gene_type:complete